MASSRGVEGHMSWIGLWDYRFLRRIIWLEAIWIGFGQSLRAFRPLIEGERFEIRHRAFVWQINGRRERYECWEKAEENHRVHRENLRLYDELRDCLV